MNKAPTLKKKLIVTADDLGLTRRINEAIAKAHQDGIVTSASLIATGGAFESAVDVLKQNPRQDAGLHLNLTEGYAVTPYDQIPSLANSKGFLYHHPFDLLNLGDSNEGTRAMSQCYRLCQLGVDAVGVSQQKSLKTQSKSLALGAFKDASGGIQSGFS